MKRSSNIWRLFATGLYGDQAGLDEVGRLRLDDWELTEAVQTEVKRRWPLVTTENLGELADLEEFGEPSFRCLASP